MAARGGRRWEEVAGRRDQGLAHQYGWLGAAGLISDLQVTVTEVTYKVRGFPHDRLRGQEVDFE